MEAVVGIFSSDKMLFEWFELIEERVYNKGMQVLLPMDLTLTLFCFISVKEAGRDFTYFIVVLVGIGVTGYFLNYYSLSEDTFY